MLSGNSMLFMTMQMIVTETATYTNLLLLQDDVPPSAQHLLLLLPLPAG